MTTNFDPRQMLGSWTLRAGDFDLEVKDDSDLASFNSFLKEHPDIRQAILKKIEQGMSPDQAAFVFQDLLQRKSGSSTAAPVDPGHQPPFNSSGVPAGVTPVKLMHAIDSFCDTRESLSGNRGSTAIEKRRTLDVLVEFLELQGIDSQKTFVHEIGRGQCVDFIHHYTSRGGKTPATAKGSKGGRPAKSANGLAARTVIKAVGHLKEFCNFAVAKQLMTSNPIDAAFEATIVGIRKKASVARKNNGYRCLATNELQTIFEPTTYLGFNSAADYFWAPLLGLFTGARLGELVTRQLDDICVDAKSGLLVLRFFEANGAELKNKNSERLVPIGQHLLDIGFARYVEHVRGLGATRLFPHLKEARTRVADPSKNQSRKFSEYLQHVGIKEGDLVFHSFRHTAITVMHVGKVPMMDTELIAGHSSQDVVREIDNANGAGRRSWSATQPTTYIHADTYERDGQSLMARLKGHIDKTLDFDLDYAGLTRAAEIVREHTTTAWKDGKQLYKSGWHTNAKQYSNEVVARLNA